MKGKERGKREERRWERIGRDGGRKREERNLKRGLEREEGSVEEEWQSLKKKVTEAIGKMGRKEEAGKWKGWWDEEYRREKKKLEEELRRWRRMSGGDGSDRYREEKRKFKELCEEKKRKGRERWEREVERTRTEGQVWSVVNRGRKRRRKIKESFEMGEWERYFRRLLGGEDRRGEGIGRGKEEKEGEEEKEIEREEIQNVIRKLKERKAVRMGYLMRYGNMVERKWKSVFRKYAIRFGEEKGGQRIGGRG